MAPPNANLRQRGSKLQVFATAEPSEDDYQTALIRQDDAPEEGPVPFSSQGPRLENAAGRPSPQPSRQQIADSLRMPLPKPGAVKPAANGHQRDRSNANQRGQGSPVRARHASPRPNSVPLQPRPLSRAESSVGGLFAGSNLGEDFMRSTMTSPSVELKENRNEPMELQNENELEDEFAKQERTHQRHLSRKTPVDAFGADDRGFLQVVKQGVKIGPSQYNDGFVTEPRPKRRSGLGGFQEPAQETEGWGGRRHPPQNTLRGEQKTVMKSRDGREMYVRRVSQSPPKRAQPRQQSPIQTYSTRRPHHFPPSPEKQNAQPMFVQDFRLQGAPQLAMDLTQDSDGPSSDEDVRQVTPKATRSKEVRINDEPEGDHTVKQLFVNEEPRMSKRNRSLGDYPDEALTTMTFSALKAQPFDFDPSSAPTGGGGPIPSDQPQDLSTKLDQRRQLPEHEQKQLFASMPIEEWEEAGDWFLDQFGALMQKMRDARREKRRVIGTFEDEAERREEEVRKRSEGLERKLARMRQDGMKVIGDAQ